MRQHACGSVHELVIGGEVTAPGSHIATFVSRLLERQAPVQLVSVRIEEDYGLSSNSPHTFTGHPAASLRHFSTTLPFLPGSWLRSVTHLDLLRAMELDALLDILAYTPNLQSLQLLRPLTVGPIAAPRRPSNIRSLENVVFKCADRCRGCWVILLRLIVPPGRCISRIAIPAPSPASYLDIESLLLRGLGTICALHITVNVAVSDSRRYSTCYSLADDCDRRRHFSVLNPIGPGSVAQAPKLFDEGHRLRDITHLTMPPSDWETLNGLLCGDVHLQCLRVINFELVAQRKRFNDRFRNNPAAHLLSSGFIRAPLLQEIALIFANKASSLQVRDRLTAETVVCYIRLVTYDVQKPPILHLVNVSLIEERSYAESKLRAMVARLEESSWDYNDPQLQWAGVPEYAFGSNY